MSRVNVYSITSLIRTSRDLGGLDYEIVRTPENTELFTNVAAKMWLKWTSYNTENEKYFVASSNTLY